MDEILGTVNLNKLPACIKAFRFVDIPDLYTVVYWRLWQYQTRYDRAWELPDYWKCGNLLSVPLGVRWQDTN